MRGVSKGADLATTVLVLKCGVRVSCGSFSLSLSLSLLILCGGGRGEVPLDGEGLTVEGGEGDLWAGYVLAGFLDGIDDRSGDAVRVVLDVCQ